MVYGVILLFFLLMFGIVFVIVLVFIYILEVIIIVVSGIVYIKFGNVDFKVLYKLIILGFIGVFIGVCFLSNLLGDIVKFYIFLFLLILGIYVIICLLFKVKKNSEK